MVSEMKIHYIVLVAVVSFALLLGGYNIYTTHYLEEPMINNISELTQVKSVEINSAENLINVELAEGVPLKDAHKIIKPLVGEQFSLQYASNASANLTDVFEKSNFIIQQGLKQGEYYFMYESLTKLYDEAGLTHNFVLDGDNLYIQLYDGNNYLYEVIPRTTKGSDAND